MKLAVLGGGQLARMLALSARPTGTEVIVLAEEEHSPSSFVTKTIVTNFSDHKQVLKDLEDIDNVTFEFENIPVSLVREISKEKSVFPSENSLYITQHRAREKKFVESLGIPVPLYFHVNKISELENALEKLSFKSIIKTCSSGYDGKGQWRVLDKSDFINQKQEIPEDIVTESLVNFDREVSLILVRSKEGEIRAYDLCENVHQSGILLRTENIVSKDDPTFILALDYASRIANSLDYVGVLTVEFFQVGKELYFNEYAPRVHNSGHWTIEGAVTSQFENHVRACVGLPLGDTKSVGYSILRNLLGVTGDKDKIIKTSGAYYHWYDKTELKEKRKVGHVNINSKTKEEAEKIYSELFT